MSGYSDAIKDYIEQFKAKVRPVEGLIDPHEVAEWAYRQGCHKPNPKTVIDMIAADIAQVFREEYRTDARGRRYRAKHAAPAQRGGKTASLWADLDDPSVPHEHFVKSFARRRQQIVGDCFQLKTDADVYNDQRRPEAPIQVVLNFKNDVEEMEYTYVDETEAN